MSDTRLALDQLDSVIALCNRQMASASDALTKNNHPKLQGALGGQIKAYSAVKNFCVQKKSKLNPK